MALSPAQFREKVANAKRNADIKQVIESTGAQPVTSNAAKGEYIYHAPYRDDVDPSLKINVHLQKFIDYGLSGSEGDVIELTRRIFGKGDINAMPFLKAVEWLERFSGSSMAPKAIQPTQHEKKPIRDVSIEDERFTLIKATPVTAKSNADNLDYITRIRKIGLPVAKQHLHIIAYKDHAAPFDDQWHGTRYGIGGPNDSGGYEVRAASPNSNFKTSLGQKDITTINGRSDATTGDIFEGRFDFLTLLEIAGLINPVNPTVILNTGRFAARAVEIIRSREDWQHVKNWRIWQQNDDEGIRVSEVITDGLCPFGYTVVTMEVCYAGYNDLSAFWTDAPEGPERTAAIKHITGNVQTMQKTYDTSASAEARRTNDARRGPTNKPSFS